MARDKAHDYKSRCIYHITMTKARGIPAFSRIGGSPEQPVVERTALGAIVEEQIRNFSNLCPALRVMQYVIMPDHIHFVIFAQEELPKVLGCYVGAEKEVRRQCEAVDGKVILLSNEPFGDRAKPAAHDFELCAAGRLLILAPMEPLAAGRGVFLFLNSVAEAIAMQGGG